MIHKKIVSLAVMLAWLVVMLGAYTRLTDAGLGCPDWPGCYGHMIVKETPATLPIQAWTEMIHRYAAGTLAILIGIIAFQAKRRMIPKALIAMIIFQALLGMWTVTLKLLPIVVMSHLLGGMTIFSLLLAYRFQLTESIKVNLPPKIVLGLGLSLILMQVMLGGWVSANYAGLACVGFPACNGNWFPHLDFSQGFYLFSPIGDNYQGGLMDISARITVQWIHRLGASVVLIYWLMATVIFRKSVLLILVSLICLQWGLGILNVIYLMPLPVAVFHNGTAALIMGTTLAFFIRSFKPRDTHVA